MSKSARLLGMMITTLLILAWTVPAVAFTAHDQYLNPELSIEASPPAIGGSLKLTIINNTGSVLSSLVVAGPKTYTFYNLPVGRSNFKVFPGTYTFQYEACGSKHIKKDRIRGNYKLTIKCQLSKVQVVNETGSDLYLNLHGPNNYQFVIHPGTIKITLLQGTYRYRGNATCVTESGSYIAKGKLKWIWDCK